MEYAAKLRRDDGANFMEELEAHLVGGVVFSTPDAFVMGKPCPKGVFVHDAWETWPKERCDAWFVYLGVGRIHRLIHHLPYHLPWIGYYRQGRNWKDIHWCETDRFIKRIHDFERPLY